MNAKKIIVFLLFIAVFVGVWNLLDFLYSSFITRSGYQFGIGDDLLIPLVISLIIVFPLFIKKK